MQNVDGSGSSRKVVEWLLEESQPSVRYLTLIDLLGRRQSDPEVTEAHSSISKWGWARDILRLQKTDGTWESKSDLPHGFGRLYVPKYTSTNWMAIVLSDLGLDKSNEQVRKAADLFFKEWLAIPSGENIFNDEVCIVGNTARMLTRFGYGNDPKVRKLFDRLVEDQKEDGGWHCFQSNKGTLDCWEALAAFAALPKSTWTRRIKNSIERGAEFYLKRGLLNEDGTKYLPWFRFHYPNHYYYDLLVGLRVITGLGFGGDKRLQPALNILKEKRRGDGTWLLDAVHPDVGKGAGYRVRKGVKRFALEEPGKPSKWNTLNALAVLKKVEEAS